MVLIPLSQIESLLSKGVRATFFALICVHLAVPVFGGKLDEMGDQVARRSSLRLTHLLFSAVVDQYLTEGLKEYRPDFLLHERYFRTFLSEWSFLLDKGEVQSTQEVWKMISQRKTYLGLNYYIWQRAFLSLFKTESWSNRINIGYTREAFLLSLLRSEDIPDFNQRSQKVVEFVSAYLLNVSADQAMALKILDSFLLHPDPHLRDLVRSIIERSPTYLVVLEALQGIQNLYLLGRGGGAFLAGRSITTAGASFINGLYKRVVKFKEFGSKIWAKPSLLAKAGAASVAVHGVALTTSPPGEGSRVSTTKNSEAIKREFYESVFKDEPLVTPFLFNLSVNTATARAGRLVNQVDFLPKPEGSLHGTLNHRGKQSKAEWLEEGQRNLTRWNRSTKDSKELRIPSLAKFFTEGERLAGAWPKNIELAAMSLDSRYDGMKARIVDKKIRDIETFRAELLSNELEVYRGKQPTLTGMLLDWGGNCVAQTLTIVSLLVDLPQIVPSDLELGVFLSSTHMEAVLLGPKTIHFLVSGKILERAEGLTVLRPQALLILAMSQLGYLGDISNIDYYLNGKPDSTDFKASSGLDFGQFNLSVSQVKFPLRGHADPNPPNAPDFANVTYAPSAPSSNQSLPSPKDFLSSLWAAKGLKSSDPQVEIYSIRVENQVVEVRLSKKLENAEMGSSGSLRRFQGSVVFHDSLVRTNYTEEIAFQSSLGAETSSAVPTRPNLATIEAVLSSEKYQKLKGLPKDLWFLEFVNIALDSYVRHRQLSKISEDALVRAKNLNFLPGDMDLFSQLSGSFEDSFGPDNSCLAELVRYMKQISPGANEDVKTVTRDGMIYKVESLTAAIRRYLGDLKKRTQANSAIQTYLNRTGSLESIEKWSQLIRNIWTFAATDQKGFVGKFRKLDSRFRIPLIRLFRGGQDPWGPSLFYFAGTYHEFPTNSPFGTEHSAPLLRYMDGLDPKKIIVKEQPLSSLSQNRCLPENVKLPTCLDARYCQAPLIVLKNPSTCSTSQLDFTGSSREAGSGELRRQKENSHSLTPQGEALILSPRDVVDLTLLSSGGLQLWNEKIFRVYEDSLDDWVTGGVFPKIHGGNLQTELEWIPSAPRVENSKSGLFGIWKRANVALINEFRDRDRPESLGDLGGL